MAATPLTIPDGRPATPEDVARAMFSAVPRPDPSRRRPEAVKRPVRPKKRVRV